MDGRLLEIVRRRDGAEAQQEEKQRAHLETVLRDWMVMHVHKK
jgi:hypothetical protein